jgi:hypothetical protein
VSKSSARIDLWLKEIAPSALLREWFGHDPAKRTELRNRYFREPDNNPKEVEQLREQLHHGLAGSGRHFRLSPWSVAARCVLLHAGAGLVPKNNRN